VFSGITTQFTFSSTLLTPFSSVFNNIDLLLTFTALHRTDIWQWFSDSLILHEKFQKALEAAAENNFTFLQHTCPFVKAPKLSQYYREASFFDSSSVLVYLPYFISKYRQWMSCGFVSTPE
jgi:hypothetical protein